MTEPGAGSSGAGVVPTGRGRVLGVDVGNARIGVATSDPDRMLATPVETIRVSDGLPGWRAETRRLAELVEEYSAVAVVVGMPVSLRGGSTASTAMARGFVDAFTRGREVSVVTVDERLTTVSAAAALRGAGRSSRRQRSVIDQAAAVVLLQSWLDSRRAVTVDPNRV